MYLLLYTITDLVVAAKHCSTILGPATCKHVGQPTQQYFYLLYFILDHNYQYSENEKWNISWKFCIRRTGFGKEIFLAMGIETTFVHPMIYTRCS